MLACENRADSIALQCSGGPPCGACVRWKSDCVIDKTSDLRRCIHWTRKLEEIERERDILNHVLAVLRDPESEQAIQLLGLIRANAPLYEIEAYLDSLQETSEPLMPSAGLRQPTAVRRILKTEQFLNIRVFPVPTQPWTTVTDDNDFVSHLISLWFTWFHPCFNWIDRDLFMRDMLSRDPRSQYCSPFLVNAILAHACVGVPFVSPTVKNSDDVLKIIDVLKPYRCICEPGRRNDKRCAFLRGGKSNFSR